MGLDRDDLPLFDSDTDVDEQGDVFDSEPVPTRRSSAASRNGFRSHRRSIEELQEERMLRRMLNDFEDFPEL